MVYHVFFNGKPQDHYTTLCYNGYNRWRKSYINRITNRFGFVEFELGNYICPTQRLDVFNALGTTVLTCKNLSPYLEHPEHFLIKRELYKSEHFNVECSWPVPVKVLRRWTPADLQKSIACKTSSRTLNRMKIERKFAIEVKNPTTCRKNRVKTHNGRERNALYLQAERTRACLCK